MAWSFDIKNLFEISNETVTVYSDQYVTKFPFICKSRRLSLNNITFQQDGPNHVILQDQISLSRCTSSKSGLFIVVALRQAAAVMPAEDRFDIVDGSLFHRVLFS